jgi:hypothetical protein
LKIGAFAGQPVAICPDKEELEELLGKTLENEPEYIGEDKDGNDKVTIAIWVKDVETEELRSIRFTIKNKIVESEEKGTKQFINSKGFSSWATDEKSLPAYMFKDAEVHEGHVGETDLLGFLTASVYVENIELDWRKLMKGNFKELREILPIAKPVVIMAGVSTYEKDGEPVERQSYYTSKFLPYSWFKDIKSGKFTAAYISKLQKKAKENKEARKAGEKAPYKLSALEYFVLDISDVEYGFTDFYGRSEGVLPLRDYDASKNVAAGNEVMVEDQEEDDDDSAY